MAFSRTKVHVLDPFDQQCWARGTIEVQFQGSLSREAAHAIRTAKSARRHVSTGSKAKEFTCGVDTRDKETSSAV